MSMNAGNPDSTENPQNQEEEEIPVIHSQNVHPNSAPFPNQNLFDPHHISEKSTNSINTKK